MKTTILIFGLLAFSAHAAMPVGTPNNGALINGEGLEEQGEGFMQLFRETGHFYASRTMLSMLKQTAADLNQRYPNQDRLQIEAISAKEGGDIEGHASHENGLDVDLGYFKVNGIEHDPKTAGIYYAPSMVEFGVVSPNFDVERNWELVKSLHRYGDVQKIFMDQVLKNKLCQYAKSNYEFKTNQKVLRSIRHVTNHADHMHVRLRCPSDAKQCRNLPEPPAGTGCPLN